MKIAAIFPSVMYREGSARVTRLIQGIESIGYDELDMFDHLLTVYPTQTRRKPFYPPQMPIMEAMRVAIAAPVERHWVSLCEAMDRQDLIEDERTSSNSRRAQNKGFADAQVAAWTSNLDKQQVVAAIGGKVPVGPANTMEEVFADPHVAARQILETYQPPPLLGEQQDEVMAEFGITPSAEA